MDFTDQKEINSEQKIYVVKRAFSSLVMNLILIQIIILLSIVAVIVVVNLLNSMLSLSLNWLTTIVIFLIILFDIYTVIRALLDWKTTSYHIQPEELLVKSGILKKKEKLFALNQLETITVRQSVFGRMLNYGSLKLFSPLMENKIDIINIPEPRKYEKLLLTKPKGAAKSKSTIIPEV